MKKISILFVCTANICRSPMAQGVFEQLIESEGISGLFHVDSAGTQVTQSGCHPDPRAQQVSLKYGVDLSRLRARKISQDDFSRYDYVLAADIRNLRYLEQIIPDESSCKYMLIMGFTANFGRSEVPDPYYGNIAGFESVFEMLKVASRGLLSELRNKNMV